MRLTVSLLAVLTAILFVILATPDILASEWKIPLAGNTFRTQPSPGGRGISRDEALSWKDSAEEYAIFFHASEPSVLELKFTGQIPAGSKIQCTSPTDPSFDLTLHADNSQSNAAKLSVAAKGYVQLNLKGVVKADDQSFAKLFDLTVSSESEELKLDFVRDNQGNMFYWGRRGPSVHLSYQVPKDVKLQYGYTELTVPVGEDPIGSYYMANGFSEGYFGIQVNSETERRVLFSVWSPFSTDNPKDIPEDQRIESLSKGEKTRVGEFGNEGSGGQSYVIYPWKTGSTIRFLTEVKPINDNNTQYTCWFAEEDGAWQLVASFRRPKTNTTLKGFHSFLESFDPSRGFIGRKCLYGNVWVADFSGNWYPINEAKFSVDPTGGKRHRLDYEGGVEQGSFFLRNCGFFSGNIKAGTKFTLSSLERVKPAIELEKLPR